MADVPRAAQQRSVRLELEVACRACRQPVQLDGPRLRANCLECGGEVELASPLWVELLGEIDERSFVPDQGGAAQSCERPTGWGKLVARWRVEPPSCPTCRTPLSLVDPGTEQRLTCSRCSEKTRTSPAPAWLRQALPTAMQVYAAALDGESSIRQATAAWWLCFQGTPPALGEQRRQAIEAAIGGPLSVGPESQGVPKPSKRRRNIEWAAIMLSAILIAVGVHQCGARWWGGSEPEEGTEVEPSQ